MDFIVGVIMRPSELFNSKLTPLLKEKGIVNMENRKEWPLSILKDVLMTLMNETPKNLLSKYVFLIVYIKVGGQINMQLVMPIC